MRGSTCAFFFANRCISASPAHAGIDLSARLLKNRRLRLPRACGDRPQRERGADFEQAPPPRMRGSTRHLYIYYNHPLASPAHAGIDLLIKCRQVICLSLPRACGDRPLSNRNCFRFKVPPPRMRGSTWQKSIRIRKMEASPAHAGIDLLVVVRVLKVYSLPRACGDRPDIYKEPDFTITPPPRMRGSTSLLM